MQVGPGQHGPVGPLDAAAHPLRLGENLPHLAAVELEGERLEGRHLRPADIARAVLEAKPRRPREPEQQAVVDVVGDFRAEQAQAEGTKLVLPRPEVRLDPLHLQPLALGAARGRHFPAVAPQVQRLGVREGERPD